MKLIKVLTICSLPLIGMVLTACGDSPAPATESTPASAQTAPAAAPAADQAAAPAADQTAAPAVDPSVSPANPAVDPAAAAAPAAPASDVATAAPASAFGIATCDDYLTQYEACVASVSPDAQAALKAGLDAVRGQWLAMASNDQQKAGLEMACKAALDQLPQVKAQAGCK